MSKKSKDQEVAAFMAKVKDMEKGHQLDLSSDEDLSIAVMNLIAIEEHLFFTAQKTQDGSYYDVLFEVREMRKTLMKMLIQDYEGEVWCTSKHLLSASMRCMEVGTKFLTKGDKTQAEAFFDRAYNLYNLFWGLNLKLIQKKDLTELTAAQKKEIDTMASEAGETFSQSLEKTTTKKETKNKTVQVTPAAPKANSNLFSKLGQVVGHALDCCRE
jgi:hypothetical protein